MSASNKLTATLELVDSVHRHFQNVSREVAETPHWIGEFGSSSTTSIEQDGLSVASVQVATYNGLANVKAMVAEVEGKHVPNLRTSIAKATEGVSLQDVSEMNRVLCLIQSCKNRMVAAIKSRYDVGHPYLKDSGEIPESVKGAIDDLETSLDQLNKELVLKL